MKHESHSKRNNMIIFAAIALVLIGGLYFWRKEKNMSCTKVCTTVDEERSCSDICVAK